MVLASFLCVYPLTALPSAGLGALDAALIALLATEGDEEGRAAVVAGVVVWRTGSLLLPLFLGAGALLLWRGQQPQGAGPEET